MRPLFAIVIIICLGFQCFVQLGIMGWYQLNRTYISSKYCVNKNKPELQCHGKCHLKKQLDKTSDRQSTDKKTERSSEWTLFILPDNRKLSLFSNIPLTEKNPIPQTSYTFHFLRTVFHPPPQV